MSDSSSLPRLQLDAGTVGFIQSFGADLLPIVKEAVSRKVDDDVTVNFIVAGATEAGKSLFIRKYLNFVAGDPNAPSIGKRREHRTTALKDYKNDDKPGIVMWDALGIGHGVMKVTPEQYCRKLEMERYDACILMTKADFASDELVLFKHAKRLQKPCFLVLTHFDEHIQDEQERSGASLTEAGLRVREVMVNEIGQMICSTEDVTLYCIDSRHPVEHDFPKLQHDMNAALTEEKRQVAEKRLFILSDAAVRKKANAWRRDLPLISIPSGVSGLSPIPGTDIIAEVTYIAGMTIKFYRDFCLSENSLAALCQTYGLPTETAAEIRSCFKFAKIDAEKLRSTLQTKEACATLIGTFVKLGVPMAIATADDVVKAFPIIGTAIGCAVGAVAGYFTTWHILKRIIDGCESDGLLVVDEIRKRLAVIR